nr:putative ring-h2 finger protein atl71 [Quercus suber]
MIMKILISFCKHSLPPGPHQIRNLTTGDQQHSIDSIELGLDEATLRNYPKLIYAQAKLQKGNSTASCCSICLADYKNTDVLRLLPDCGHLFHVKCVDPWLQQQATCPVCRNSPLAETALSVERR